MKDNKNSLLYINSDLPVLRRQVRGELGHFIKRVLCCKILMYLFFFFENILQIGKIDEGDSDGLSKTVC